MDYLGIYLSVSSTLGIMALVYVHFTARDIHHLKTRVAQLEQMAGDLPMANEGA
ncbi:MAG: hypothetical protein AAGF31_11125 [Planctomycetota bacterium]